MEYHRFFHYVVLGTKALFCSTKKHLGQGESSGVIRPLDTWGSHAWLKASCLIQEETLATVPPQGVSVPFCSPSHIPLTCFCTHRFRELKLVLEKQSNVFLWKWAWSTMHCCFTAEKVQYQLKIKWRWAKEQSTLVGALLLGANRQSGGQKTKDKKCDIVPISSRYCKDMILLGLIQNLTNAHRKSVLLTSEFSGL